MGFNERTVEQMREEFVKRVLAHEKSKSALCREYGISRPTGDKWIERYINGESMSNRSRAPHHSPSRIDTAMEEEIIRRRIDMPAIGAVKHRQMMHDEGIENLPSTKTYNNIFKRNGLITPEASEAAKHYTRFEKPVSNEMWQADFKGEFKMTNGIYCFPLNIIDDHSRYNLCIEALANERFSTVKPVFTRVFEEYGLPYSLLCDNGNPWAPQQQSGYTQFEVWLMDLDVLTLHGRSYHPQTQGKEERFNGSLYRECIKLKRITDFSDAQLRFDEYRNFYNHIRPHHSLNLDTPSKHYTASQRRMPDKIEEWEYGPEYELRKVKKTGYFEYRRHAYFLSESFAGRTIAIRESHIPGQVTIVYRQFRLGRIDLEEQVYTIKRAFRLSSDPRENV